MICRLHLILVLLCMLFAVNECATTKNASTAADQYAIVFDAGSSHTDMFVYKWSTVKINGTGEVKEVSTTNCHNALSSFKDYPKDAGVGLHDCLNVAKKTIPEAEWTSTQLHLGATAGMRVVDGIDHAAAQAIITSVQTYAAANTKFIVRSENIGILPAVDEGGYSWAAINYQNGTLHDNTKYTEKDRPPTTGSLDLGGASTQFSVEVTSDLLHRLKPTFVTKLFGHKYNIYTDSFLCYGKDQAKLRFQALLIKNKKFASQVENPCLAKGLKITVQYSDEFEQLCSNSSALPKFHKNFTLVGTANEKQCLDTVRQLFKTTLELHPSKCPFNDKACAFAGVRKGEIRAKFLGTSALFYDAQNIRILSNDSFVILPLDVKRYKAARVYWCQRTAAELEQYTKAFPKVKSQFNQELCFSLTYEQVLLLEIYQFSDKTLHSNIMLANDMNGANVDWALGLALEIATDK